MAEQNENAAQQGEEELLDVEAYRRQVTADLFDKPNPQLDIGMGDELRGDFNADDYAAAEETKTEPEVGQPTANDNVTQPTQTAQPEAEKPTAKNEPVTEPPVIERNNKVSYNGQDYAFTDDEYKQAAQLGIEYAGVRNRLANYMPYISEMEANPQFADYMVKAAQQFKQQQGNSNVPLQTPQAETAPADNSKEPTMKDDETYEDYEKRVAKWKEDRMQAQIDAKVNAAFQSKMQAERQTRIEQANKIVVDNVRKDPNATAVLNVMKEFSPALKQQIDRDGALFMSFYDDIRTRLGLKPYFGAPPLYSNIAQKQTAQPAQPAQPQPTVQKQAAPAPFTESAKGTQAQHSRASIEAKLPDFKTMSDEDFLKYKERVMHRGI